MKLLLDECVNQRLRAHLAGHDVFTVGYLGWGGLKNGVLLRAAAGEGFDALLTIDQAMPSQHNAAALPLTVVILQPETDRLKDLVALVPALLAALSAAPRNEFVFVP